MAAPALANYLYGTKDPSELNQEQKDTIVSILNLATVTTAYTATDGNTTDAVSASEIGKVGMEWNWAGTPQELQYQAELDALWIEVAGDREKYFEGIKKIGERDALALDILLLPVGAGAKLAQAQFKAIEVLVLSANRPIASNGLSAAARKLSSHSQRSGGTFPKPTGSIQNQNQQAERILRDILSNPNTTRTRLSRGGFEFRLPNGQGVRYNANGEFSGFLDPKN